jgi:hypothetical protein
MTDMKIEDGYDIFAPGNKTSVFEMIADIMNPYLFA